jgi:hypothetical protein
MQENLELREQLRVMERQLASLARGSGSGRRARALASKRD